MEYAFICWLALIAVGIFALCIVWTAGRTHTVHPKQGYIVRKHKFLLVTLLCTIDVVSDLANVSEDTSLAEVQEKITTLHRDLLSGRYEKTELLKVFMRYFGSVDGDDFDEYNARGCMVDLETVKLWSMTLFIIQRLQQSKFPETVADFDTRFVKFVSDYLSDLNKVRDLLNVDLVFKVWFCFEKHRHSNPNKPTYQHFCILGKDDRRTLVSKVKVVKLLCAPEFPLMDINGLPGDYWYQIGRVRNNGHFRYAPFEYDFPPLNTPPAPTVPATQTVQTTVTTQPHQIGLKIWYLCQFIIFIVLVVVCCHQYNWKSENPFKTTFDSGWNAGSREDSGSGTNTTSEENNQTSFFHTWQKGFKQGS